MTLSIFAVVHRRDNASALFDDPLVHCYAGKQIVLTYISRQALEDYFRIPGDERITLAQWNLVVDRNLDAFKRIIEAKFVRDDWEVHNACGQSYPKLLVTLEDMQRSGEKFTIEVLKLKAGFWRPA
jgi:hypothetical protein